MITKATELACLVVVLLALGLCATRAHAQLPTSDPTGVTTLSSCPSNLGFYSDPNNHPTCYNGTISCSNTAPITPTWSVTNPGAANGTVVFFTGGGGESAASFPGEEQLYVPLYTSANYQVVQVSWPSDWELVNSGTTSYTPNILNAACRPASLLKYIYKNVYGTGGMCAQGASAGGGGLAYALAWYGAFSYLDKAVFTSGPVFSDIEQGCEVPNSTSVSMCPSTQLGCNGWTSNPLPTESAEFTDHAIAAETWTGGTTYTNPGGTCGNSGLPIEATTYNSQWLNQSIVNFPSTGQQPSFSYSKTSITAWLCEGLDQEGGLNNSAPEGEIFFQQFTSSSQAGGWLQINGNTLCQDTEGVGDGTPPPSWVTLLQSYGLQPTGSNAIGFEMSDSRYANRCQKLH
jgi:hypothetical protein